MATLPRQPSNKNFLSPLGFNFEISRTPGMNYFVQSASIPSLSIGTTENGTPFNRIRFPGDKASFGELNITFRVDEELRNYYEIYTWITKSSRQKGFEGYASLTDGVFSDATLSVLSSSKNPIAQIYYTNLFPISLSELVFDSRLTDVDYIDVIATFSYQSFDITYLI